jgi:hypothetical protein
MRIRHLGRFCLFSLACLLLRSETSFAQLTVDAIQKLKEERVRQLQLLLPKSRGDAQATVALATIFSEEAISQKAKDSGIDASDSEVEEFLVPLLAKQGLIRVDGHLDIKKDSNVQRWLKGQNWSMDQLFNSGKILLLWTKIVSKNTVCTEQDVKKYVEQHPEVYLVRERLQLDLTQFDPPSQLGGLARGVAEAEVLAPRMSPVARDAIKSDPISANHSKEWEGLRLYVELNRLDPNLHEDLKNKKEGDGFGPLSLSDGTVISGSIAALLPSVDLSKRPEFWQYAVLLTKLDKSNQKDLFDQISKSYLNGIQDKAVRGLFGDLLGTVGTGIGAVFGGLGAPIGGIIGGAVGGWVDGQMNMPSAPAPPPSGPPPGFAPMGFPPPTFPNSQAISPYLGPASFPMPNVFQGGFRPISQMNFAPAQQFFRPYFPPTMPMWGPPIFMPMPIYY